MANISEIDLQNLRHLIGGLECDQMKMSDYAMQAKDKEIQQFFQQSAQSAGTTKEQLMQFLN